MRTPLEQSMHTIAECLVAIQSLGDDARQALRSTGADGQHVADGLRDAGNVIADALAVGLADVANAIRETKTPQAPS